MAENTEPGGSEPTPAPENNATPPTPAPSGNDGWKARAEDLQKQLDSMTANRNLVRKQLNENETANKEKLEKALAEKEDALSKLSQLEKEQETTQKQQAISSKKSEILQEYPDGVRELANDLGVELSDAEDPEAIKNFSAKLDKIKERVETTGNPEDKTPPPPKRTQPKVTSNNGSTDPTPPPQKTDEQEMSELADKLENVTF